MLAKPVGAVEPVAYPLGTSGLSPEMDEICSPHELAFGEAFLLVIILCHHLEKLSRSEEKRLGSDIVVTRKNWRCKVAGGFMLIICPKSIID